LLIAIAGYGIVGLVAPRKLLQPKGEWWFSDWMTGRITYTSIKRVRWTCSFLLAVAFLALAVWIANEN
jgi:hypothetical protein